MIAIDLLEVISAAKPDAKDDAVRVSFDDISRPPVPYSAGCNVAVQADQDTQSIQSLMEAQIMSTRLGHILLAAGIKTLCEAALLSDSSLLLLPGVGHKTLTELRGLLLHRSGEGPTDDAIEHLNSECLALAYEMATARERFLHARDVYAAVRRKLAAKIVKRDNQIAARYRQVREGASTTVTSTKTKSQGACSV